jgi:hypothetical protein
MVNVFSSRAVYLVCQSQLSQTTDYIICICCFPRCPDGATCLPAEFCFIELAKCCVVLLSEFRGKYLNECFTTYYSRWTD